MPTRHGVHDKEGSLFLELFAMRDADLQPQCEGGVYGLKMLLASGKPASCASVYRGASNDPA
jgi:hypothetical protein